MIGICTLQFIEELHKGEHNLEADVLVACLVTPGYVFNISGPNGYGDIDSRHLLPSGNGYTQKAKTLTVSVVVEGSKVKVNCNDFGWTADGGFIGPAAACLIVNTSHINETIVCAIMFDDVYAASPGDPFTLHMTDGLISGYAYNPGAEVFEE